MGQPPRQSTELPTVRVQSAIALDGPTGPLFGTTTAVSADRVRFVTHGKLAVGQSLPARIEVAEDFAVIHSTLRVVQIRHSFGGGPAAVEAQLVVDDDQSAQRLRAWVLRQVPALDQATGGFPAPRLRPEPDGPTELRQRPVGRPSVAVAVRAAVTGRPAAARAAVGVRGPAAQVALSADGGALLVRWDRWPDAAADWARQLAHGTLGIPTAHSPARGAPLQVTLVLPDGVRHVIPGQVSARAPGAFTVRLAWTHDERAALASALS